MNFCPNLTHAHLLERDQETQKSVLEFGQSSES